MVKAAPVAVARSPLRARDNRTEPRLARSFVLFNLFEYFRFLKARNVKIPWHDCSIGMIYCEEFVDSAQIIETDTKTIQT